MEHLPEKFDDFVLRYHNSCKLLTGSDRTEDSYLLECLKKWIKGILNNAKFKIGDKVLVTGKINYEKAWGWVGSKHTFTQIATVRDVAFDGEDYCYTVMFEKEFWTDDKGKAHPVDEDRKHVYSMWETMLSNCPDNFIPPDPIGFKDFGADI